MKDNKKDKRNIKDLVIKIILIVIIIILLIHNCVLVNKKKNAKTPSGNVNIIEIICVDNDKCDVTDKDSDKGTDSSNNNVDATDEVIDGTTNNNSTRSRNNRKSTNDNGNGSSSENNGETITTDTVIEPDDELFVRDKKILWSDSSDLKIFTNSVYNFEEKIAPETSNTYQFIVKNSTSYKVKYNISFVETNPYNINMKYRLKKNNTYIVDHYVSYNELSISDQLLNAKNNDTFYLEWKWISSDHDNDAGENEASYSLKIDVNAESVD